MPLIIAAPYYFCKMPLLGVSFPQKNVSKILQCHCVAREVIHKRISLVNHTAEFAFRGNTYAYWKTGLMVSKHNVLCAITFKTRVLKEFLG